MNKFVNYLMKKSTENNNVIKIAVHEGVFHADDVTAIALLKIFIPEITGKQIKFLTKRVSHQEKNFDDFDLVIDVGGKYDGIKYFDHHQWTLKENPHAAAGLVWQAIKEALSLGEEYAPLEELIEIVDQADIGARKAGTWEYPSLISKFNHPNPYDLEQEKKFEEAIFFAEKMIASLKNDAKEIKKAKEITKKVKEIKEVPGVVELPEFTRFWNKFINGILTPGIEAVIWFDKNQNCYKAQVVPVEPGSFKRVGRGFKPDTTGKMSFVHTGEFFCVAPNKEVLLEYLQKHFK